MPTINNLPRTIIKTYLSGLRLPLNAVERVTNKSGTSNWPPAVAFETFEAEAKKVLGALIRDDELVREGTLQRAKVEELAEAERLEVKAEQKRLAADAALDSRRESADEARARVVREAANREQQVNREKDERERATRDQAQRREQAAATTAAEREKSVAAQERAAARTRIAEESDALAARAEALAAAKKVQVLDTVLEAKRTQRKSL